MAAAQVAAAITASWPGSTGFDDQFRETGRAGRPGGRHRPGPILGRAGAGRGGIGHGRRGNLRTAIAEYGPSRCSRRSSRSWKQAARAGAAAARAGGPGQAGTEAARLGGRTPALFEEKFRDLAQDSPEFGDLLRQIVPEFHVYLVRLCDGGHLLPRARVRLNLAGIVPDAEARARARGAADAEC